MNHIFLRKSIVFTPVLHSRDIENGHFLLKSGFCELAKRAKLAYFDGNLLNRKMVVAKTLLKSGFLLILMLLKSGFHCTIYINCGLFSRATTNCHQRMPPPHVADAIIQSVTLKIFDGSYGSGCAYMITNCTVI